jgi:uncharacterized repeat protein (TIGR01451 family)
MRTKTISLLALAAFAALAGAVPPAALGAEPVLDVDSSHIPASIPAGSAGKYEIVVSNTGDASASGNVTVDFVVPTGLEVTSATDEVAQEFGIPVWNCSIAGNSQSVSCAGPEVFGSSLPIESGKEACQEAFGGFIPSCRILLVVKTDPGLSPGIFTPTVEACGGGAVACASATDPTEVGPPAQFGIASFDGEILQTNGDPATQAGSHPYSVLNGFFLNTIFNGAGIEFPVEQFRDGAAQFPPGLVGNPQVLDTCTQRQLRGDGSSVTCPPESQVGTVTLRFGANYSGGEGKTGVYNMERPPGTHSTPIGTPALFAFNFEGALIQLYAKLRSGDDYGVTMISKNAPQTLPVTGVGFDFWGVPADPSHDSERRGGGCLSGCASAEGNDPKPFINLATACIGPVDTFLTAISWEGSSDNASFLSHMPGEPSTLIGAEGCNAVPFAPSIQARPTTNVADAPSGLDVNLHVPQDNEDPDGIATAHLRDTTITLPEGLVINPSGANGLDGCSLAEFGYTSTDPDGTLHTTPDPASCPNASKLGTVEVETPLVDHPLEGSIHIADPYQNPFGSLLAVYIAIDDPATGTVVKLAGEVKADPNSGRLTSTFKQSPQLPFEDFNVHIFGGAGGSLRTPATCGAHTTTSSLVPWTAPEGLPANPSDSWEITQGPGGSCAASAAALPHTPSFDAGAVSPIAGAHSPFVVNLRRADGTQNFHALSVSPPPGLVAKLAGTETCPDSALAAAAQKSGNAEKQSPSCPAASRVGVAVASAGAGPAPYHAQGTAYLTGPYKGAPLSLAVIAPAVAGPFDLGTVVVRTALYVDSKTARINAVSDPLPSILQGIPLDVQAVHLALDKPQFSLNPTSCDPMAVNGLLMSTLGQTAALESRFQLGECGRLGFKPSMSLSLKGGTKRGKHPALTAILTPGTGNANLASISVALPPSEFLDQANIGTVCTRVQFAADQCPAASVYGTAKVMTPLLDYPLQGNVYLRSSDNKLPDLVPAFQGPPHQPIELESAGRTDTLKGGLRNSFEFVPDAPFSKLVVQLAGGPDKGLLINSRNICQKAYRALVNATAHNGKKVTLRPKVKASCKGKTPKRKAKRRAR